MLQTAAIENCNTIVNVDTKISLETEFSKWQSKALFLSIFDPHSSIVKSISYCRLPGVDMGYQGWFPCDKAHIIS